jgi:hypothetical protein
VGSGEEKTSTTYHITEDDTNVVLPHISSEIEKHSQSIDYSGLDDDAEDGGECICRSRDVNPFVDIPESSGDQSCGTRISKYM